MQSIEKANNSSGSMDLNESIHIKFQRLREEDETSVRNFLFALSHQSLYYRFMSHSKLTSKKIKEMLSRDMSLMQDQKAIILTGSIMSPLLGNETIAMGAYYPENDTHKAEVALLVADRWQGRAIGSFLFKTLATLALHREVALFTALVCMENIGMQRFLEKIDLPPLRHVKDGLYYYEIDLSGYQ